MRAAVLALLLAGCTEWGPERTEPAEVDSLAFIPEGHGTGFDTRGNIEFTDIPARYAVIFRCQHGKFVVEGDDERHKRLWQSLKEREPVTVRYRQEVGGGKLDFVDATRRGE